MQQGPYVIACGDEGVQINVGRRLGLVGAGLGLAHAEVVIKALNKRFGGVSLAASQENDWVKEVFSLDDWEQTDATMQQRLQALADQVGVTYAGLLPFTDPKEVGQGVKGHMVRPHAVHIANAVCLTLGGGEQKFHLGHFLISADWVADVPAKIAKEIIQTQLDFYAKLVKADKLPIVFELEGELGAEVAAANQKALAEIGIKPTAS